MRLWVPFADRKPSPPPLKTDERWPVAVGLVAWLVAAAVGLASSAPWSTSLLWACVVGITLGLVGFLYVQLRRR